MRRPYAPRVMRRVVTSLIVLIAVVGSTAVARAQSAEEVAEAERHAAAAADARRSAAAHKADAEQLLVTAVREYEALTARITELSFSVASVIEDTRVREAAYGRARDEARRLVVAAYTSGAPGLPLVRAADVAEIAFAARVRGVVARVRAAGFAALDASTTDLDEQRSLLEAAVADLAALRDQATALVPRIEHLVRDARVQEAFAVEQEAAAVAVYEIEAAELEAALALVSPRALLWRDLVAEHFDDTMLWPALQVLDCESGGDPDAFNEESGSAGLFQFLEGTWAFASVGAGFAGAERTDPVANVASAAWLVARSASLQHPRGAWGHWVCQPTVEPGPG